MENQCCSFCDLMNCKRWKFLNLRIHFHWQVLIWFFQIWTFKHKMFFGRNLWGFRYAFLWRAFHFWARFLAPVTLVPFSTHHFSQSQTTTSLLCTAKVLWRQYKGMYKLMQFPFDFDFADLHLFGSFAYLESKTKH